MRTAASGPAPTPTLYQTVFEALRREMRNGALPVGASLPSEADLSARFQVSRITIRHALQMLQTEGYIRKAKARRAVVAASQPAATGWVVESLDDIAAMVGDAQLDVLSWRRERSAPDAADFGLPAGTALHCLRGVLRRAGVAYARSIIYFPPPIGAGLSRDAFDDPVVFRVMQRELGVVLTHVEISVWAERATPADATALPCAPGDPMLLTRLCYHDAAGAPAEIAYSRGVGDATRFSTRVASGPSRRPG